VPDNYGYTPGTGGTARSRKVGSIDIPMVEVDTAIPTVLSGFQNIGVTTAQALTVPTGATHALLTVDTGGGNIRFREDGTNPTTSIGLLVQAGAAVELTNLANIRIVSTTGTTTVNVSYRKYDA
jgi:hypothetical protein